MRGIDPFDFYKIGQILKPLGGLEGEAPVHKVAAFLFGALGTLSRLLNNEFIEITHCRHETKLLHDAVEVICKEYLLDDSGGIDIEKDWKVVIPGYKFIAIKTALERFEHNFAAELREAATYYVSQVGMYNTADLVERADHGVPDEVRQFVSDKALGEIRSAGRCLAFDLPTAAGFHVLRAAECVLDDYYRLYAGQAYKEQKNWGSYVAELEKLHGDKRPHRPSVRVIRNIRQIKDLDRNPIMHPRTVLENVDALLTFHIALSAIGEMAKEIKANAGQEHLNLVGHAQGNP